MDRLGALAGIDSTCTDRDVDPLQLAPAQMPELGYRTIDLLIERLTDPGMLAMRRGSPRALAERINATTPESARPWAELLDGLDDGVLTYMSRLAHPSYFAFIAASSTSLRDPHVCDEPHERRG
jgi:hypothetical protein